jgi:hypothetical protein
MRLKKIIQITGFLLITLSINQNMVYSQGSAGAKSTVEPRYLVDMNTAGILSRGMFAIATEHLPEGVFILKIDVGIFNQFNFGISYGASNFIGKGDLKFYNYPGVNVKLRIFEEEVSFPAILFGFDSQGKGNYYKDLKRFEVKSPGFYLAASKNLNVLGMLSFHGALNYSLETNDQDNNLNLTVGVEKTIGDQTSFVAEYDVGLNDDSKKVGKGKGYLNFGVRWSIAGGLTIGFDFRNIVSNRIKDSFAIDRSFRIEFARNIF